jgi:protein PET100
MFPIGIMYYFGTNLDNRFSVPDFWPKQSESHRIPFDKDEIREELGRLREKRLARRARRLEMEDTQAHAQQKGAGDAGSSAGPATEQER